MARVYATHQDLTNYTEGFTFTMPAEPESARLRTRASELVDEALLAAVYDTDPTTRLPTDPEVAAAMRDAVCAQVVWWDETGDEQGAADRYTSVSIGSVTLARGGSAAAAGSGGRTLGPPAATHLRLAGLVPGAVTSFY
jgi:hypothetical protein